MTTQSAAKKIDERLVSVGSGEEGDVASLSHLRDMEAIMMRRLHVLSVRNLENFSKIWKTISVP